VPYVVGSAGKGLTGNNGGDGGASTFGSYLALPGGKGGGLGIQVTGAARTAGGGAQADAATGAAISVRGQIGADAFAISSIAVNSGAGASTELGVGAPLFCATSSTGTAFTFLGNNASGYGAAGSGALCGIGGAANAGGDGAPGILIVEEYA